MDYEIQAANVVGTGKDEVLYGSSEVENKFIVDSGNVTISNYQSWEQIQVNGTYQDSTTDGNDFIVNTAEGSIRVLDARGKMVEIVDSDGDIITHAHMQVTGAEFNGQGTDFTVYDSETGEFETYNYGRYYEPVVVVGANNGNNTIIAGDGFSNYLWGGNGGNDVLIGGDGVDHFIYNYGDGNDVVMADEEDIVNLGSVTFEDIKGISFEDYAVRFIFNDYGSLGVMGRAGEFDIDGQKYTPNYETKTFELKADDSDSDE